MDEEDLRSYRAAMVRGPLRPLLGETSIWRERNSNSL